MIFKQRVTGIVLAAGNSTRFGQNKNKNLFTIKEKPILLYSIEAYNNNLYIDDIIVVIKKDEEEQVKSVIESIKIDKTIKLIYGSSTRQKSVMNALKNTNSKFVIINDGARPLIKQEYINKCLEAMSEFSGVTIGVKSKDTVKIVDNKMIVTKTTNRNDTWLIQTPQCFDRKLLLDLHKESRQNNITDDCMLLEENNYQVKVIEGNYTNIKVTTYSDLAIIKEFINNDIK